MTKEENQEYVNLLDKREQGKLTDKEYRRYLVLLDKVFQVGIPRIVSTWTNGFGL